MYGQFNYLMNFLLTYGLLGSLVEEVHGIAPPVEPDVTVVDTGVKQVIDCFISGYWLVVVPALQEWLTIM